MSEIKPSARRKARRFAMQGLYQWQMTGTPVLEIEKQFLEENDMKKVDMIYFRELLRGVTTSLDMIEGHLAKHLDRKLSELDPVTEAILRLGTFELLKRIDIPYRVVINESIELAKDFGSEDSHRYVNGILDKLSQDLRAVEIKAR